MSRDTGTTGTGEDAQEDVDALRRTNPRRAARIEAERTGLEAGHQPTQTSTDVPFDQDAPERPAEPPYADQPYGDAPPADQAEAGQPYADQPHGGQPDADQPYSDQMYADQPYADQPYADQPYADQPYSDQMHADQPGAGQPYAEQPYAEDPFGDPAVDQFGDPVRDGYVDPRGYGAVAAPARRRRRGAGLLALVVLVFMVGGAGWFAYQGLRPVLSDLQGFEAFAAPEDYEGAGTGSVEVVVEPGDTGPAIGRTLADADVVASVDAFIAAANANPEFPSVQPGTYTLPQQIPAVDAVAGLLDPANRSTNTVVIAEGLRVDQILDRLAEGTGIPRDELQDALERAELPAAATTAEGVIDPAEGWLYPDGYQFGEDPTADGVIAAMIARGQDVLADLGVAPEDQLRVVTEASLVQGEARLDEDFGKVAQVIDNRLAIDQPLGLDSTVNYATQTFDTRTTADQRASDSPYNTYRFPGLPPGPIKSPGRQALEAVTNPTPGPWLYFVTVDLCTGETAFAETFEEHQENVQVLNAWQRENTVDGELVCA